MLTDHTLIYYVINTACANLLCANIPCVHIAYADIPYAKLPCANISLAAQLRSHNATLSDSHSPCLWVNMATGR